MIQRDALKQLIKGYFPEGNDDQINAILNDLSSELEVLAHAKIRESVSLERINRII